LYKKITAVTLCIMLILALIPVTSFAESVSNNSTAVTNSREVTQSNGDLVVYMFKDNSWQVAGSLSYDSFSSKKELRLTDLPNAEVRVKIVQDQGGNAHLDAVLLGGMQPIKVTGEDIFPKKLSNQDFDVITLEKKGIELIFPQGQKDRTLEISARIEAAVISQTPFLFPVQHGDYVINKNSSFYTYKVSSDGKTPELNGILSTLSAEEPFFKQMCLPGSGHPSGFMYGWVLNDRENLYVAIDATSDNTLDGDKDYAKVYVKTAEGIQEFKQSVPDTKWGSPSFIYTDRVAYQHKAYEFVIPLAELGISDVNKVQDIPLAFEVYGTMADPIFLEFDNYLYNEENIAVPIKVMRPYGNYYDIREVVISYSINPIGTTATEGQDYTLGGTGELVFEPGVRERTIFINLIDDSIYEPVHEIIKLEIAHKIGLGGYVGSPSRAILEIVDNDDTPVQENTIQFAQESYETPERDGVSVYITRTGNIHTPSSVIYTITDITATRNQDYDWGQAGGTVFTQEIEFKVDQSEYHLWIPIRYDTDVEPDETFEIALSDPTGGFALGNPRNAVVTILNDDEAEPQEGTINFEKPSYSVKENQSKAVITAVYTPRDHEEPSLAMSSEEPIENEISVRFSTSDGTAKEGSDYTETSGTLTFGDGDYTQTFEIPIINDSKAENNETVNLRLFDATGGIELGELANAVLTIVNDDKGAKPKKYTPPKEVPPSTSSLPDGTIIGRMQGYITLSEPTKIADGSKEIQLAYNTELSRNNIKNTPRVYYWNTEKKNWVALATYATADGKVKAINDNGYRGWFVVFGVIEPEFSDLQGSIFEQLLNRMNGLGIIEGIPIKGETEVRTAKPEQSITRSEFTMLISRILNIDIDDHKLPLLSESESMLYNYINYNDANKIAEWVANPVGTLTRAELIAGEGREFRGEAPITRIESAVMISKALRLLAEFKPADFSNAADADKVPEWAKQQVAEGVMTSYADGTIRPNENITRADAFEMLYKLFVIGLGW
jgi:hypothetical protein